MALSEETKRQLWELMQITKMMQNIRATWSEEQWREMSKAIESLEGNERFKPKP